MKAIINTKLVLEDGIVFDAVILFDNEKIINFGTKDQVEIPEGAL